MQNYTFFWTYANIFVLFLNFFGKIQYFKGHYWTQQKSGTALLLFRISGLWYCLLY